MAGMRMPAEWEPHERTLIGWPCRPEAWGETLTEGRAEFAAVANAIAGFETVTMICASEEDATGARDMLRSDVEIVVEPMDGAWLRDNGPIYVTDGERREARLFRFNAWGERHAKRDRDAALGASLVRRLGDKSVPVDIVLEGGSITVDGAGNMITTEGCVMHPNRNWRHTRDEVETVLKEALGLTQVIWLEQGLAEDLERNAEQMYYGTDGHIDLFCAFIAPGRVMMLSVPDDDPNAGHLARSRATMAAAGIEVEDFPYMSAFEANGRRIIAPYLNFYVCNGGVICPVPGVDPDQDAEALARIRAAFSGREVVPIRMRAGPMQGGAIHCLTMQVPKP